MALGPQSPQKPRPTASVFVYMSPSGHVFNIARQAMIKTYNQRHQVNRTDSPKIRENYKKGAIFLSYIDSKIILQATP